MVGCDTWWGVTYGGVRRMMGFDVNRSMIYDGMFKV